MQTFDAGQLRHRITFQRHDGTTDAYGDPKADDNSRWVDVVSVYASIRPLRGREFFAAQQAQSEVTHSIVCRYRTGLSPAMRICFGSRRFSIVSILNRDEAGVFLDISATEITT